MNTLIFACLVCVIGVIGAVNAQTVFTLQCGTNIAVKTTFDFKKFEGTWFEVQVAPATLKVGQCRKYEFKASDSTSTLAFESSNVTDQLLIPYDGVLSSSVANNHDGHLTLAYKDGRSVPFNVIDTDYDSFALVYSCMSEAGSAPILTVGKLSKGTSSLSIAASEAIDRIIAANPDIPNNNQYQAIGHTYNDCFAFPTSLKKGEAVIVPGKCEDNNIEGLKEVDLDKYKGEWYIISNYLDDNQNGQCNQAKYIVESDKTFKVENNEVIAQNLIETKGTGQLLANGQLNITFPNSPLPYKLTIVGTDYTSYSILYSCENVGLNRRFQSWVLSRDNVLTADAKKDVDDIISKTVYLNERYYIDVSHSPKDCFYFPLPGTGPESVIFRGQCDESITGVAEFNAKDYTGTWFQIERYPQPTVSVENNCAGARYELNEKGDEVKVLNWEVVDKELKTMEGSATLPTEKVGQLDVVFPTIRPNATSIYVVATDYENYSLVYRCTNTDDKHRSVTAWKLSRSREMSPANYTAINSAMENIEVIDARYFRRVIQNAECPTPNSSTLVKSSALVLLICFTMKFIY